MDFELKTDEEVLLKRLSFRGTVSYSGKTPTRQEVRAALAHHLKGRPEQVIVRAIKPVFGRQRAAIVGSLYHDRALLDRVEPIYLRKLHGLVEEKPDAKAEAKPEPKAQANPEAKAEAKPEPKVDAKPAAEAQ